MRIFRPLSLVGLLTVLACGGGDGDPAEEVASDRLLVTRLTAPPVVPSLRTFHVEGLVADPVGIESVELRFDGKRLRWSGDDRRFVRIVAELTPTRPGRFPIEIAAVGTDGTRVGRAPATVDVTQESDSFRPALDKDVLLRRLASWKDLGLTKDELYARGPEYGPGIPPDLVPVHDSWWLRWMDEGGPQPFRWAEHCPGVDGVTPNGEVLRCWLARHPEVADAIIWVGIDPGSAATYAMTYPAWPDARKEALDEAFYYAWTWLESSLQTPFPIPADPSPNQIPPTATSANVALNGQQAWVLYLATVAHSLALEIGGFVPWSILTYHPDDWKWLLSATSLFEVERRTYQEGADYAGHWTNGVVHAFPKTTFEFFVDEGIVRPTHYETITQLLAWSGGHLSHTTKISPHEPDDITDMELAYAHWQYHGWQPVQRVLAGTWRDHWKDFTHWTRGCIGTSRMYASILRALNIPAYWLHGWGNGDEPHLDGHHAPVFPTIGQAMSHGDDMLYFDSIKAQVTPPPSGITIERMFLPWATFVDWFYVNPDHNVGRQKYDEFPIDVLPDDIMDMHCADRQDGLLLPDTRIYARFSEHYSVGELFGRGIWGALASKRLQLGWCP